MTAKAVVLAIVASMSLSPSGSLASRALDPGTPSLTWPITGAVIRGYVPPAGSYSSGHRGIDIAAPVGTPVFAAAAGTVSFAGRVAGALYVTIDHGRGLSTTYSWLSEVRVHKGQAVSATAVIALSGNGHPATPTPHLHFGVKVDGSYVDPLSYLAAMDMPDLVHLAPLVDSGSA